MLEKFQIKKELNIKKVIIISLIITIAIAMIVITILYISKDNFRKWVDIKVLRKNITIENISTIDLDADKNNQIYCYSKYICILNERNLKLYNLSGQNISEIGIDINTALFSSKDKYLAIAEKNGQELCMIYDKQFLWEKKVEGQILKIYVNRNGYVALVTTDTTFKSIITLFDSDGNQLLKNYSASNRVVDVSISNDNKYVAFAELDTSGTLIKSNIKIISVQKALDTPKEAIIKSYEADTSKMIVNITYQDKENLVCVYDDSINMYKQDNNEEILKIDDKVTFMSADFNNSIAYITENVSGIFNSESTVNIINTSNNQRYAYNFEEVPKEMYTCDNIIGINVGSEIYFISTNGMLIKKYTSSQEITNVLMSSELGLIIYKDRIEIINL